ncbi:MAG: uroporphyrinogen-III synthase, partial [Gammaproteobacteria bacterium]|nr:uroporphyrinogen-III synthase [Gammaproteobacteria bacterium]
ARALRELALKSDLAAEPPTTAGIIACLEKENLQGRRVGLQLYGKEPNRPLQEFLERAGATVRTVAPYVYADAADDAAVRGLLARLAAGEVDAIAFTSSAQVERLFAVAPPTDVSAALAHTLVAAIGPIVAQTLVRLGVHAHLMPEDSFSLKPLTSALEAALPARG